MITKPSITRSRGLKILLGVTLGIAVALTLLLLFVPEKQAFTNEAQQGMLLCANGEVRSCTVSLSGTISTYAFEADAPICKADLQIDGQEIGTLRLTFSGGYAASGEAEIPAVMTKEHEVAAQIKLDGVDCLLLSPAPDEASAQKLLARFLADTVFARQQGWEFFRK